MEWFILKFTGSSDHPLEACDSQSISMLLIVALVLYAWLTKWKKNEVIKEMLNQRETKVKMSNSKETLTPM